MKTSITLRPEGAALRQPRATPWEFKPEEYQRPEGATLTKRNLRLPFQGERRFVPVTQGVALGLHRIGPSGRLAGIFKRRVLTISDALQLFSEPSGYPPNLWH